MAKRTYSYEQFKADCARISGLPPVSMVVPKGEPTDSEVIPATKRGIDFAAAVAVGLGPRPKNSRER